MKIWTATLLQRIDAELARREQAASEEFDRSMTEYVKKSDQFVIETGNLWRMFADRVLCSVNEGIPVSVDLVPEGLDTGSSYNGRRNLRMWEGATPQRKAVPKEDLLPLRRLLEDITDEEITTNELQRLGFKVPMIFSR